MNIPTEANKAVPMSMYSNELKKILYTLTQFGYTIPEQLIVECLKELCVCNQFHTEQSFIDFVSNYIKTNI